MFNDIELEKRILSQLLNDHNILERVLSKLFEEMFYDDMNKTIFKEIDICYHKYHGPLTYEIFSKNLNKEITETDMVSKYTLAFSELKNKYEKLDVSEIHFLIDELKDYYFKRQLNEMLEDSVDNMGSKKGVDNLLFLETKINDVLHKGKVVSRDGKFVNDPTEIDRRKKLYLDRKNHPEKFRGIKFGLVALDEICDGLYPEEIGLVISRPGVGKSHFLFTYAYNAARAGYNVMYITLEMSYDHVARIYDSHESMSSYTKIKRALLNEEEEKQYFKSLEKQKEYKRNFHIIDIPAYASINLINAEISQFKRKYKLDLVVIDYLWLIEHYNTKLQDWQKWLDITRILKQIARTEKIVIFTAAQTRKESVKVKSVGTEQISLADIGWHFDFIMHIYQKQEDKLNNVLKADIVKHRDGQQTTVEFMVNWDYGVIKDKGIVVK